MNKSEDIREKIEELMDIAKFEANISEDPKYAALCETTFEVLSGLEKAHSDYLGKNDIAWQL